MPLSEEEQRILHEMEQKLYEHDRAFADRVSTKSSRRQTPRSGKAWIFAFIAGFVLLIVAFRSSLLLGSIGFLDHARFRSCLRPPCRGSPIRLVSVVLRALARRSGMSDELSEMRRRLRSRFGNRN